MGRIIPVRECIGYVDPNGGRHWTASCEWAKKWYRHQWRAKSAYTTEEPPHQYAACAKAGAP